MSAFVDILGERTGSKQQSNVTPKCMISSKSPKPPPRPEKSFRLPQPSSTRKIKPILNHGSEDFPQTPSLDIPSNETGTDLSKFLCEMKLPQRIRITESFLVPGCSTALKTGDVLLLHFIYDNPTVHATTSKGTHLRLPIHAEQKYEILPLDPRLDDMMYNGTQELMHSSPLPASVRVVEAFYSDNDFEDNTIGDIIDIEGFEYDEKRGKLLVGRCGSTNIKYSTNMTTTFTSMLLSGFHRMIELKDNIFPQRVRIPDDIKGCSKRTIGKVLHLNKFSVDSCVVATRADDSNVYSIPVTTPINFVPDPVSMVEKHILDMLPALYPRVNTSWGLVDPSQVALASCMQPTPQPLEQVLLALTSQEEKSGADVSEVKSNITTSTSSPGILEAPPELPFRPSSPLEGRPRLPLPPGKGLKSISSDRGFSQHIDTDSDDGEYEYVDEPVNPLLKDTQKKIATAVKSNGANKERTRERELIIKQKMTVAPGVRNDRKLPQSRDAPVFIDDEDDDEEGDLDYLEPIPHHSLFTLSRSFTPGKHPLPVVPSSPNSGSNLREYTIVEVGGFLREHAMGKYVDTFRNNGIDGVLLVEMQEVHMLDLEMSRFHALKLKIEIGRYKPPSKD